MNCYCRDKFDWLMNMIKEGDCFITLNDISNFIDEIRFTVYEKKIWIPIL